MKFYTQDDIRPNPLLAISNMSIKVNLRGTVYRSTVAKMKSMYMCSLFNYSVNFSIKTELIAKKNLI